MEINDTFMAIQMDRGVNHVTFEFKPVKVMYAFYLSFGCFILLSIFLAVRIVKQQIEGKKYFQLGLTVFCVLILALLVTLNLYGRQTNKEIYKYFSAQLSTQSFKKDTKYVFNIDDLSKTSNTKDHINFQINNRCDVGNLIAMLDTCKEKDIFYAQINKIIFPELKAMITDFYPHVLSYENLGNAYFLHASKPEVEKDLNNLISFNDFEKDYANWAAANQVDSAAYSGKRCIRIDSINTYSPAFSKKFSTISGNKKCIFKISMFTKFELGAKPVIVFTTHRKDKNIIWAGENVYSYFSHAEKWRKVYFLKEVDSDIATNDIVEIYVWNTGKKTVWIDDFKIELLGSFDP
jgi:hypothetical protein